MLFRSPFCYEKGAQRMDDLFLAEPDPSWKAAAEEYVQAYRTAGEPHIGGSSSMEQSGSYEEWLEKIRGMHNPPADSALSPATTFFAVRKEDRRIVGTIQVRHRLTDALRESGGNIGYSVRPDQRKRGYATQMLFLALDFCRGLGLNRVLLDCLAENAGSEKTIRRCGGVLAEEALVPGDDGQPERIKRFWIAL